MCCEQASFTSTLAPPQADLVRPSPVVQVHVKVVRAGSSKGQVPCQGAKCHVRVMSGSSAMSVSSALTLSKLCFPSLIFVPIKVVITWCFFLSHDFTSLGFWHLIVIQYMQVEFQKKNIKLLPIYHDPHLWTAWYLCYRKLHFGQGFH